MAGIIDVLAAGKGHEELTLPDDHQAAKAQVDDLLKKGYAVFVSVEEGEGDQKQKTDKKVTGFDGDTGEYICAEQITETKESRYAAASVKATAIAPTAGG